MKKLTINLEFFLQKNEKEKVSLSYLSVATSKARMIDKVKARMSKLVLKL